MKSKSISLSLFVFAFSLFLFTSCADKKNEAAPAAQEKESVSHDHDADSDDKAVASADYQCPMDCEDGKTYAEAGSCPVCKMDLKAQKTAEVVTCKKGKDGKCACKKEECKCKNCPNRS
jgi:hypothetical protein